jgi:hypothetical protein
MPKLGDMPFFLGGRGKSGEWETLFENDDCRILKRGKDVDMSLSRSLWTTSHTTWARRYGVSSIHLRDPSFGDQRTTDFLLDLPTLTALSISIWSPVDFSGVARMTNLNSLRIDFGVAGWRLGDRIKPADYSGLVKLEHADIMMCSAFESILKCRKIRELTVRNDCDHRLRDLDLTLLPSLRDLQLDHCPKLRKVSLHPKAKVRALRVGLCGSYKIDWQRMGKDLRFLVLGGRLTFPLEEVLNAPNLELLHTLEIRKLPPLGFLRDLTKLRSVLFFSAPPGPKFSEDDVAVIAELRSRRPPRQT